MLMLSDGVIVLDVFMHIQDFQGGPLPTTHPSTHNRTIYLPHSQDAGYLDISQSLVVRVRVRVRVSLVSTIFDSQVTISD
jgi:hypothetical protein